MTQSVKCFFFQDKSVDVDSDDNKKEVRKMQDDDFRLPSGSSSEDESEIESESDEECESELAGTNEEEVVIKREGDFLMPVFKIVWRKLSLFFVFIFYQVMAFRSWKQGCDFFSKGQNNAEKREKLYKK